MFRFRIMNFIFLFTKFLYFLHGMSNPIIYNLMSTKFRRSFRDVVLCKSLNRTTKQVNLYNRCKTATTRPICKSSITSKTSTKNSKYSK
jgi:hypothetical protein